MSTLTHERILTAVGHVLDLVQPHSFAIRDTGDSLIVETFDEQRTLVTTFSFSMRDLLELLEWHAASMDKPELGLSELEHPTTLQTFLERHELVGAAR